MAGILKRFFRKNGPAAPLPATAHGSPEIVVCLRCNGHLSQDRDTLRCRACGGIYAVVLGVPLMVEGVQVVQSPRTLSDESRRGFFDKYGIEPNADDFDLLDRVLSYSYNFQDTALDAENNFLLNRVELEHCSERQPLAAAAELPAGPLRYSVSRHYIPAELPAGVPMSSSVRLKNTGDNLIESPAYVLSCRWSSQVATDLPVEQRVSHFPVPIFPGRELTVPLFYSTPREPGSYTLVVGLRAEGDGSVLLEPCEIPLTIRDRVERPYDETPPVTGPKLADYDEDHREAIRIVERMVESRLSFQGLEIAGSSTPATTNLPCDVVNIDIDVQALQVGWHVLKRRGHLNVRFVCCDSHALPFAPGTFDFAAMFAALHHFSDPVEVLKSAARVIRADGFLAVM